MGRPKYQDGDTKARARIEGAFWALLAEDSYDKITVSTIVKRAKVNRNTFYYHFEDIRDLALQAVSETFLDPRFATVVMSQLGMNNEVAQILDDVPDIAERLGKITLIAGSHSPTELKNILKEQIRSIWYAVFQIDYDALEERDRLAIEYVLGGILSLLAYKADVNPAMSFSDVSAAGIDRQAATLLRQMSAQQHRA